MGILEESDDFLVIAIEKIIDDLAKPFPLFAKGLEGVMSFRGKSSGFLSALFQSEEGGVS